MKTEDRVTDRAQSAAIRLHREIEFSRAVVEDSLDTLRKATAAAARAQKQFETIAVEHRVALTFPCVRCNVPRFVAKSDVPCSTCLLAIALRETLHSVIGLEAGRYDIGVMCDLGVPPSAFEHLRIALMIIDAEDKANG